MKKYSTPEARDRGLRQWQAARRMEWARWPETAAFIQDHAPAQWEKVRACGERVDLRRDVTAHSWSWTYRPCRRLPWCIHCAKKARTKRAMLAFDAFNRCTPKGQQPRFIHVVVRAPVYEQGRGWGWAASQDPKKFRSVVFGALKDVFGDGIGAHMSYQDFGEAAFAKRTPHMDLTLNGWMLGPDGPTRTPRMDLTRGWKRWDDAYLPRAQVFGADAASPGNTHVTAVKVGEREYRRILKYQVRELVDLTKLSYNRDRRTVWWVSYREDRPTRTPFTVAEFKAGLAEYAWRLNQWPDSGRGTELHVPMGHMSKARIAATEAAMASEVRPHWRGCICGGCNEWEDEENVAR